jgi:hypothetical protein
MLWRQTRKALSAHKRLKIVVTGGLVLWLAAATLTVLSLTGCATGNSTKLIRNAGAEGLRAGVIEVPAEAGRQCTGAALPLKGSKEAYAAFGVLQTGKLEICEERRALAVEAMTLHNRTMVEAAKQTEPRPWWAFWRK